MYIKRVKINHSKFKKKWSQFTSEWMHKMVIVSLQEGVPKTNKNLYVCAGRDIPLEVQLQVGGRCDSVILV